jgi:2-oxoglutarate dehydrogenase E2 component (dihydrolipoamide succinyltransferase)
MAVNIVVPELGESIVEATVLRWHKHEGERVAAGETVVELETDKVNLGVSAPRAGLLTRIEHKEGEDVKIGQLLGVIEETPVEEEAEGEKQGPAEIPSGEAESTGETTRAVAPPVRATPIAERMASETGVDLHQIHPAAPDQRITKQDVQKFLENQQPDVTAPPGLRDAPAPREVLPPQPTATHDRAANEERVRMSRRRQTIGRRLVEAQHAAAMLTTFNEVDMTAVLALRQRRKEAFKQRYGVSLGITSFFVKAAIGALKAFPELNAEIQGDEMVLKHYYDIGIAVGAEEGLVVPVLRDANYMSFAEIEKAIGEFVDKAETGKLSIEDLRGGSFTITNGGIFGSLLSTPILNPPQVGILGLHKFEDRPIAREGQVVIRSMMYVALSYDHRIVDGRAAVQFLVRVKELAEDPASLLLEG